MDEKELDAQPPQQDTDGVGTLTSEKEERAGQEPNPVQLMEEERLRRERRAKRREEMKRQKERQRILRRRIRIGAIAAAAVIMAVSGVLFGSNLSGGQGSDPGEKITSAEGIASAEESASAGESASGEDSASTGESAPASAAPAFARLPGTEPGIVQNLAAQIASGNSYLKDYAMEHAAYSASSDLFFDGYQSSITEDTPLITSEDVISSYAVLLDLDSGEIVAQKAAKEIINPASMTKILTLLVAAEHISDLDDTFTVTLDITDFAYTNGCSVAGFEKDETVTVRDLLYGTILPSGGDAAAALAVYAAGSMENFVEMMNDKLEELGLSETAHFTNCVGLYDEEHYCTVYDMAMILKAAVENDLCREILSAHTYTTSCTTEHPEGLLLSNWFLRKIEDKDTHGEVICAKTGFVNQSGCCGASYAVSNDGSHYICVTGNAWSSWRCIYDHVAIYQEYTN